MTPTIETILFETSPYGTLDGIVEHDSNVVYFYLNGRQSSPENGSEDRFGTRACWVRNLKRGPIVIDKQEMAQGRAPMMPRNDCIDSEQHRIPCADDLEIVWFEEGNGAALIELEPSTGQRQTICVIPPWSGVEGFHGYAANCAHETQLAWPMPENPSLQKRIDLASEFWSSFTPESSPFSKLQPRLLQTYDERFGNEAQLGYYSLDGGTFPQRGLVHYRCESETILLTVAMSMCPQPAVEMFVDQPSEYRRVELGVRLSHDDGIPDEERIESIIRSMGSFATHPWKEWTWFGPGHTIAWSDSVSGKATLKRDDSFTMPDFRNDPVHVLWIEKE